MPSAFSSPSMFGAAFPKRVLQVLAVLAVISFLTPLKTGAVSLDEALDATNLVWTTGGDGSWSGTADTNSIDFIDCARSPFLAYQQTSWLQTTVSGPGNLSFWYRCPGRNQLGDANDSLILYDNDQLVTGSGIAWSQVSVNVAAGTHNLKWLFYKGYQWPHTTQTYGYLDQVIWLPDSSGPPQITTQPHGGIYPVGSQAYLSVIAQGGSPLNYQWKLNGTDLAGATTTFLRFSSVDQTNLGTYSVLVSNAVGAVTSDTAVLAGGVAPSVTLAPLFPVAGPGESVNFNATASGTPPLSYLWSFKGTNIPGATTSSFTVTNVQFSSDGAYSVVTSNLYGSATSTAVLRFSPVPLASALNSTDLVWNVSTVENYPTWFGQTNVSLDGASAQTGGGIPPGGWIETTVTGPGAFSFNWSISAFYWGSGIYFPEAWGWVDFSIDGVNTNQISSNSGWSMANYFIPAGTHTLRWTYVSAGSYHPEFAAWVDQAKFVRSARIESCSRLNDGRHLLFVHGIQASNYVVEATSDLLNWGQMGTSLTASNWYFQILDSSTNLAQRFYRLKLKP